MYLHEHSRASSSIARSPKGIPFHWIAIRDGAAAEEEDANDNHGRPALVRRSNECKSCTRLCL
jgi:hypothetical protein